MRHERTFIQPYTAIMDDPEDSMFCEISVAFYNNDRNNPDERARGNGLVGWYKGSMDFWHTEVAFPPDIFQRNPQSRNRSGHDKLLFAYGVFADHTDALERCVVHHLGDNATRVYFDNNRKYVDIVSSNGKKRKETTKQNTAGDIATDPNIIPMVQTFEFYGDVNMFWNPRPEVFMNRVNRGKLKNVTLKVNNATSQALIESPGMVFGKPRAFSNPAYRWLHFTIPMENALEAANFAQSQVGKPHDGTGIYWAMVWPKKMDYKSYYCVNFVAVVLQRAGMLHGVNPNMLLPDDLYKFLSHHPDKITSVNPYFLYGDDDSESSGGSDERRKFVNTSVYTPSPLSSSKNRRNGRIRIPSRIGSGRCIRGGYKTNGKGR